MSVVLIVTIAVIAFIVLALLEVPVGISVGIAGLLGIVMLNGPAIAGNVLGSAAYGSASDYALLVVPMYILMGSVFSSSGIGAGIYRAMFRLVRKLPGGLPVATVFATGLFSGVSGSSAADVAAFGRISAQEMSKFGYSRAYAGAVVAAAGAVAVLIPPSVIIVLYAIIAEENIGVMIVAGVIPGIGSVLALAAFIMVTEFVKRRGETPPELPDFELGEGRPMSPRRALFSDMTAVGWALVLFGIVVGGMYGGIFTATEAGAIAAFVALIVGLATRRAGGVKKLKLIAVSFRDAASVTAMIFLLVLGGAVFSYLIASARITPAIADFVSSLDVPPLVIVGIILLILLPLGAFLDGMTILVLTVPLMAPVVTDLGLDGVWFGILVLKMIEIGLLTPPVGINAFIISGLIKVPVIDVFKKLIPFVLLDLAVTAVFFFFPEIVLWLPEVMGLR
ncbi:MAG TPA: TRAP transporter large permease [Terrimesophilobacter sp.]|nr:TRAP transporter large permease [Terrimesophilobacter sp.]